MILTEKCVSSSPLLYWILILSYAKCMPGLALLLALLFQVLRKTGFKQGLNYVDLLYLCGKNISIFW